MSELLLEFFSEEIPARMQADAAAHLKHFFEKAWSARGIQVRALEAHVTPRRLALIADGLPATLPKTEEERRGPRIGAPEQAMSGFLKSTGLTLEQLEQREGYYYAMIQKGGEALEILLPALVSECLSNFPWPKSMQWGSRRERWVRPLKSILCQLDGRLVPLEWAGIAAGNTTFGHRFLAPGAMEVRGAAQYKEALAKAYVMLDREARKAEIIRQAEALAAAKGGRLRHDPGLIEEVCGLVEWPLALCGGFDPKYLSVPQEVLVTSMRSHQKYFVMEDASGALLPHFILVSNMVAGDGGKAIIGGNERVLRARLDDAAFFWELDRKTPLESLLPKLDGIIFHARLGSIGLKTQNMARIAQGLAAKLGGDPALVLQAAKLAKADLVSGVVGEFPELQGVMGEYMARAQSLPSELAQAIGEHYRPQGPNDRLPDSMTGAILSLADKLDSLTGLWAAGEKPTGSKDPYALRRSALGIVRIILEKRLRILLRDLLKIAVTSSKYDVMGGEGKSGLQNQPQDLINEMLLFFGDRLKAMLRDQGVRHDVLAAIYEDGKEDDLARLVARVTALQTLLGTADGANLLAAYRRAGNILSAEEKKDARAYAGEVDAARLVAAEEKTLFAALQAVEQGLVAPMQAEDYTGAMTVLAGLRAPVDVFFEKLRVNDDDAQVRENRLHLLARARAAMQNVADFSQIES